MEWSGVENTTLLYTKVQYSCRLQTCRALCRDIIPAQAKLMPPSNSPVDAGKLSTEIQFSSVQTKQYLLVQHRRETSRSQQQRKPRNWPRCELGWGWGWVGVFISISQSFIIYCAVCNLQFAMCIAQCDILPSTCQGSVVAWWWGWVPGQSASPGWGRWSGAGYSTGRSSPGTVVLLHLLYCVDYL